MHSNWRDCKQWLDEGLRLQTSNNQTAKLFDVNLAQYVSLQNFPSHGGLTKSLDDMIESDPYFVLGRVFKDALSISESSFSYDAEPDFKTQVDLTLEIAQKSNDDLSERERLHVEALKHLKDGWMIKACDIYDQILLKHPSDLLAHNLNFKCLFSIGQKVRLKTSTESVFKRCPPDTPLRNFLYADMAFSYNENQLYQEAEKYALQGLSLYRKNGWATHALSHVYVMTGRFQEGLNFLDSTVNDWQPGEMLTNHLYWHSAILNIEVGNYERAVEIWNEELLKKRLHYKQTLGFLDASSLLYRLKLQGIEVTSDMEIFSKVIQSRLDDHTLPFNDLHLVLALLAQGRVKEAATFVEGLEQYVKTTKKDTAYKELTSRVSLLIGRGVVQYEMGNYVGAVEEMMGVMDELVVLGGSEAQRDVFKQIFLSALIHSPQPSHHTIAEELMDKCKESMKTTPLIDRYYNKYLTLRGHVITQT